MDDPAHRDTASTTPPARVPRRSGALGWIVLVLLVVVALAAWRWWQGASLARAAQADQHERVAALEARVDALRRDQRANAGRLQQAEATNRLLREELLGLGQRAALLEDTVADLAGGGGAGLQALRLDEAELLLVAASERLLAGDLEGARRAQSLAAAVLEPLDDPDIIDLRQALAQERDALAAIGTDPAIAARVRLGAVASAFASLPERTERRARADAPWWERLAARVVDVRPSGRGSVVAPPERAAGLAALEIELALARAALERRDDDAFDAALGRVQAHLLQLWPPSPARRDQQRALAALRAMPLRAQAPELGSTLAQLRRLRAR